MSRKIYDFSKNVYDAFQERMDFVFGNYEYVYVTFSGGKDSGVLLNLVLDYKRTHNIRKKIGVLFRDYECGYSLTIEYIQKMIDDNIEDLEPYWVCLPCKKDTPINGEKRYWIPWDPDKRELWVRELPLMSYVISLDNNPFDFYKPDLKSQQFYKKFGQWYSKQHGGKTCCLTGVRSNESLQRYRAIAKKVKCIDDKKWTKIDSDMLTTCIPLYDWSTSDVWYCNYKFGYKYNHLYDLYYQSGIPIEEMRVGSPFLKFSISSLDLFKTIEPQMYDKLNKRIDGVDFASVYSKNEGMGYRNNVVLPPSYKTYEEYLYFLIGTLRNNEKEQFLNRFEILKNKYANNKLKVSDDTYKKFCGCILKNDYSCSGIDISNLQYQEKLKDKRATSSRLTNMMFGGKYE